MDTIEADIVVGEKLENPNSLSRVIKVFQSSSNLGGLSLDISPTPSISIFPWTFYHINPQLDGVRKDTWQ